MTATPRRRTIRRTSAAVVGTATAAALLVGCAQEVPQPTSEEPFSGPMLTADQEQVVIDDVAAALDTAAEKQDPKRFGSRVTGPAKQVRSAEIELAEKSDGDLEITEIPTTSVKMVLPTTQTWPRVSINITEPTEDLGVNRLVTYTQDSARDNYAMWSWVQLIPGTVVPNFADAEVIGSEAVAADDDSLAMTPTDALAQYADLVDKGPDSSEYADAFELPADAQDLVKRVRADARSLADTPGFDEADGSVNVRYAAQPDLLAVRTLDGGAVVLGALDGNYVIEVEDDGEIPPLTPAQQALIDADDATNVLYTEFTDQVALYVPPAGSDAPVQPIGMTHTVTGASTKVPKELNTDREK